MSKTPYTPPIFEETAFNCPHCNAFAEQIWSINYCTWNKGYGSGINSANYFIIKASKCSHCDQPCLWINEKLAIPDIAGVQQVNDDLNDDIKELYNEAGSILHKSPRAAVALLRLALQKLCKQLGAKGDAIHKDINYLRDNKNLSPEIVKAMDTVRIAGNEAVHPGTIDFNDNNETANRLFGLINFIANDLITQPKERDAYYKTLPDSKKIETNDGDK